MIVSSISFIGDAQFSAFETNDYCESTDYPDGPLGLSGWLFFIRISRYFWLEWDLGPETAGFGMAMLNCVNWHTFPAFAHRCTSNAASSHEFFFFFFFSRFSPFGVTLTARAAER
jgi:hypothetical protein